MAEQTKEEVKREELTADEMANIIRALTHPQPYADLPTAGYFITLCNKLRRMSEQLTE